MKSLTFPAAKALPPPPLDVQQWAGTGHASRWLSSGGEPPGLVHVGMVYLGYAWGSILRKMENHRETDGSGDELQGGGCFELANPQDRTDVGAHQWQTRQLCLSPFNYIISIFSNISTKALHPSLVASISLDISLSPSIYSDGLVYTCLHHNHFCVLVHNHIINPCKSYHGCMILYHYGDVS